MNTYRFRYSVLFLLIALLLVGCASAEGKPVVEATAVPPTSIPATETAMLTLTPIPQMTTAVATLESTSTPESFPFDEEVKIPKCQPESTTDTLLLHEIADNLFASLAQMDSFQFHAVYQFTSDEHYIPDQLALEIDGKYSGLKQDSDFGMAPISDQYYRSHTTVTDLHTQVQSEAIIVEALTWVKLSNDLGWIEQANDAENYSDTPIFNLAEILGPYYPLISFSMQGAGFIGHVEKLELDGETVTHRCWHPDPTLEETPFGLWYWDQLYTILEESEIHLWLNEDETQLLRLAITGKQVMDVYFDIGEEYHDPPNDFMFQVEISNINQPVDIQPPPTDQIAMTVPNSDYSLTTNESEEFPVPDDAVNIPDPLLDEIDQDDFSAIKPREFAGMGRDAIYFWMLNHLSSAWEELPYARRPVYESKNTLPALFVFYTDALKAQGWHLDSARFWFGQQKYFLIFTKGSRTFPIILEEIVEQPARIWAFLPQDESATEAAAMAWTTFEMDETGISGAKTLAIDQSGLVWAGGGGGISVYDGTTWTNHLANQYSYANSFTIDSEGNVWATIADGIRVFDGDEWINPQGIAEKTFDYGLVNGFDQSGQFWTSVRHESYLAVWDGITWRYFASDSFNCDFNVIFGDSQGRVWFGKEDGDNSVFYFDGIEWYQVISDQIIPLNVRECADEVSCTSDEIDMCEFILYQGVKNIVEDSNGRIWIGSGEGLKFFDNQSWTIYDAESGDLPFEYLGQMTIDHLDRIWVVSSNGGIHMLDDTKTWQSFFPGPEINLNSSDTMATDLEGNLWIASGWIYKFESPNP